MTDFTLPRLWNSFEMTGDVLVLHQHYHRHQLWLPFVNAVWPSQYSSPPQEGRRPKAQKKKKKKAKNNSRRLVHMPINSLHIYIPEKDVDQMILPFKEAQVGSTSMYQKLRNEDFPAFERRDDDSLFATTFRPTMNNMAGDKAALEWVKDNCNKRVAMSGPVTVFESEEDYKLAVLAYRFIPVSGYGMRRHSQS